MNCRGPSIRARKCGFTLIELMIAVVVLAILLVLAAPSFYTVIKENQSRTQASRIVSSVNLARATAARENTEAIVCATSDAASCTGESSFQTGWLVFADRDGDSIVDDGELVTVFEGFPGGFVVKHENGVGQITFYPDGSASSVETIVTCPPDLDNRKAWSVVVNTVGSPRMRHTDSGDAYSCD